MADAGTNTLDHAVQDDDLRFDDHEFNPRLEPKKAYAWLNLLKESEKAFEEWNDHCDNIDKAYANIERLTSAARDREFQMLWANIEVEKPSIYAKPPIPVVTTKYKDRRPVPQAAAELLERCANTAFDLTYMDDLMREVRDGVVMHGRGVPWCRYEKARGDGGYYDYERVCIEYKQRKDFLHSLSRCWQEVWWVAAAAYLTREEARERFREHSGDAYKEADYKVDKDSEELGGTDNRERAKFWEVWSKKHRKCVWVAEGVENILDEDEVHLDLKDFFPCPKPAYGVTQPGSLVPVPDALQYWDQLRELNLLTAKIHALSDALEARGFYPAGSAEVGDAVAAALANKTPGRLVVPISNWSAFGATKEVIVWLPIAEIAQTIQTCVSLRKEIIQDIYQIKGLSDIMRGATDPGETLGAQELKSQFGSTRIRDKQMEIVRVARDCVAITADIICEHYDEVTIIEMSQTQLPTEAMKQEQVMALAQQLQQQQQQLAMAKQMVQQQAQQQLALPPPGGGGGGGPPSAPSPQQSAQGDQMQQMLAQGEQLIETGQQTIQKIMAKPTFEQVMHFLRNNRARAFVLDIETDSTILIDENTEKQRRAEFTGMLAQLLPQLAQMIQMDPMTASFCGEMLKFSVAPYRASRQMDAAIDDLVMLMEGKASLPRGDDPQTATNKINLQIEQMKDATEKEKIKANTGYQMASLKQKDDLQKMKIASNEKIKLAQMRQHEGDAQADAMKANQEMVQSREEHRIKLTESAMKMRENQQKMALNEQQHNQRINDMNARAAERRAMQQFKMMQPQRPTGRPM